jgi:Holliday junction resolvasome RuvABC DNA-binding subunit
MKQLDKRQFDDISRKMDMLIRLSAMNAVSEMNLTEQVTALTSLGFKPSEIAAVLAKPLNIITATLSYSQKRRKKKN